MRSVLLILLLLSCGRIKVDDVEIKDSTHTVEHRIILDSDISLIETKCMHEYPNEAIKQQDCIDGYMDALDAILQIDNFDIPDNILNL